jgi:hypothetical protein
MTAPPMNFCTVPPWRSSTTRARSNQRAMSRLSDSGSRRSPRLVDPARSLKTTVTTLRVSAGGASSPLIGAPHPRQNRARSGFCSPQTVHASMRAQRGRAIRLDLPSWWRVSISRTAPDLDRIDSDCVSTS